MVSAYQPVRQIFSLYLAASKTAGTCRICALQICLTEDAVETKLMVRESVLGRLYTMNGSGEKEGAAGSLAGNGAAPALAETLTARCGARGAS